MLVMGYNINPKRLMNSVGPDMARPAAKKKKQSGMSGRPRGGGPAAAGGYNYQAAVTGIAMAHAISGLPLGWLDGLLFDAPCEIRSETGGGGDDIRLNFGSGDVVEAQIKKGLRAGKELKAALARLAEAIHGAKITFGCLVAAPASSRTVTDSLAADIVRMGEDANATVDEFSSEFRIELLRNGMDVRGICSHMRIVTVPALDGNDAAVRTAMALLSRVCAESQDATRAWDRLYRDAHLIMARRGRRTRSDITRVLRSANIRLNADPNGGPAGVLSKLCDWTLQTTAEFSILGIQRPLLIDEAWLPVTVLVREKPPQPDCGDLSAAIERYHSTQPVGPRGQKGCDPTTLSRFRRHVVVVGGAGMGKTTLLKKLARCYAKDNFPVLRVNALAVARRMVSAGEGFGTAAFTIGLDDSGLAPELVRRADLGDWVILCDGLDECGSDQQRFAEGLVSFVAAHPNARVVVTTRSIGYRTAAFANWRHYEMPALDSSTVAKGIAKLLIHIQDDGSNPSNTRRVVEEKLEESEAGRTAARSPLLLSLCAALIARGTPLGQTRLQFYRAVFKLLEAEPPPRAGTAPATSAVLGRFLDVLGWTILTDQRIQADAVLCSCGKAFQSELDLPSLKAQDLAEKCFAYWHALGLIEKVHHAGDEALTFVHKTFGEFAAGRFIATMPPDQQGQILTKDAADLSEAVAFASALGAGAIFVDDLIRRGFEGTSGQSRLLQALEILSEADPPIDGQRVEALVRFAADRLAGDHQTWALDVGAALLAVANRYRELVASATRPLRLHKQSWTRLGAWAVTFTAEPSESGIEDLLAAMESLAAHKDSASGPLLGGGWRVGGTPGRTLFDSFACGIAERIVTERSCTAAEELLIRFEPLLKHGTLGFYERLFAIGAKYGIQIPAPGFGRAMANLDLDRADLAARCAFIAILTACGADEGPDNAASQGEGPLYNLAGFLGAIELLQAPLPEIWPWCQPFDLDAVAEAYRHFAVSVGVPLDRMVTEAATLRGEIQSTDRPIIAQVFSRCPHMDAEEPVQARIDRSSVDFARIERALRHSSSLAVMPALNVALLAGSPDIWRSLAANLLRDSTGISLWAAAHLIERLPVVEGLSLLRSHITSTLRPGSEYIFREYAKICPINDPGRIDALRWALLNDQPGVAVAAAEWARDVPNPDSETEAALLLEAFEHWRHVEGPYPHGGGVIPQSPREELLEALVRGDNANFEMLVSLLNDTRPDVVRVAQKALIFLISHDGDARHRLLELAISRSIPIHTMKLAFEECSAYSSSECTNIITLFNDTDPGIRFVAIPILELSHISDDVREQVLGTLRNDPEPQIREAAIRMTDKWQDRKNRASATMIDPP